MEDESSFRPLLKFPEHHLRCSIVINRSYPAIAAGYAKVQITYQDGSSKVATVTSQYDAKNDWINLRAYGFTYSTPQLAIGFKQPEQAPKQEIKVVAPKKTTITCVKGKTTKKVTAVKPKCPSGYKKK
jgi:siroheme synthase